MAIDHVCWECGEHVPGKDRKHLLRKVARNEFIHYMCIKCYIPEEFERLFREWN